MNLDVTLNTGGHTTKGTDSGYNHHCYAFEAFHADADPWELIPPVAADMNTAVRSHHGWYRPEVCIDGLDSLHWGDGGEPGRHDFVCLSDWHNPDPVRTWLRVDHGSEVMVGRVRITNDYRTNKAAFIEPWELWVGNDASNPKSNSLCTSGTDTSEIVIVDCSSEISGRYLFLNLEGPNRQIHIRELQAFKQKAAPVDCNG